MRVQEGSKPTRLTNNAFSSPLAGSRSGRGPLTNCILSPTASARSKPAKVCSLFPSQGSLYFLNYQVRSHLVAGLRPPEFAVCRKMLYFTDNLARVQSPLKLPAILQPLTSLWQFLELPRRHQKNDRQQRLAVRLQMAQIGLQGNPRGPAMI